MSKVQLGVFYGSRSCEHEVSIISAVQMMKNVNKEKYDVIPVYISMQGEWFTGEPLLDIATYTPFDSTKKGLKKVKMDLTSGSGVLTTIERTGGLFAKEQEVVVAKLDCVIPVFHGLHGEDGTVQGLLELCNIPYASSGVGASAIGMDKVYMKQFFQSAGFPVLPGCWYLRKTWQEKRDWVIENIEKQLPYPVFAKPACLGSSIGVSRADNREELMEALDVAFEFDKKVLIEKGVNHPIELNCSVLGGNGRAEASEIEMPISEGRLLDFAEKYLSTSASKGMASLKRVLPAPIDDALKQQIQGIAKDVFLNMECKGVCRIDFMYDEENDKIYITEINTIPGSMAFYLWEASGLKYADMIDKLVEIAMECQREKDDSNFAFSSDILSSVSLGSKAGLKSGSKGGVKF